MGQTNFKERKKPGKSSERFNDIKFVQYELSKEEKATCKGWINELGELDSAILKFCESGYSISLKWDNYSQSFAAFARHTDGANGNAGLMLAGRGSTPLKAMKQALFKHYMVFDESWVAFAESREAYDLDD